MTKVTTTYRGALHSLNAMPLRGEGDPGEPYPLNNSPFPNGPFRRPFSKCLFSYMFFTPNGAGSVFTCAPVIDAHAAHPSFWDPGWEPKIWKMQWRFCTTTESPHLPPKCCSTHPLHLKMGRFGSLLGLFLDRFEGSNGSPEGPQNIK